MTGLNERIKASGIKKSYIAERLGISSQHFSNKITGRTNFTIREAIAISHILNLTNEEFFYFFGSDSEKCEI